MDGKEGNMKVFKIEGVFFDKKGVSHKINCFVFANREKFGNTYSYALKDNYGKVDGDWKAVFKKTDEKDWSKVVYEYFIEEYDILFDDQEDKSLFVEEVTL